MRFVIQRVSSADVKVDGEIAGKIDKGFLVFIGVSAEDLSDKNAGCDKANAGCDAEIVDLGHAKLIADKLVKKLVNLRIFDDEDGKTNLDLNSVDGKLLLISQFTLYADCKKGNRPSFINAGAPDPAEEIYEYIIDRCREELGEKRVERGIFGADMKVSLVNDGPFTVILDSDEIL
ncbi:MAG: D-tyrosyl-tRNA(Tyr) deacylase [Firmicutes bacterium]|nr:D-tyrosyl-tRNA(Tyr) deacylase [Bacillota bacterium]